MRAGAPSRGAEVGLRLHAAPPANKKGGREGNARVGVCDQHTALKSWTSREACLFTSGTADRIPRLLPVSIEPACARSA